MKPTGPSSQLNVNTDSLGEFIIIFNKLINLSKKEANTLANARFLHSSLQADIIPKTYKACNKKHLVTGNERKLEAARVTSKIWMEEDLKEEEAQNKRVKEEIGDGIKNIPEPIK